MTHKTYVGVDPGWKNLGLAILIENEEGDLCIKYTSVLNPSSFKTITEFINHLDQLITPLINTVSGVVIERFVAYGSIHTAESENINMLIGALCYYFGSKDIWNTEPVLVRAIEWKTSLVKRLFKIKGFNNPSDSLDKKFSIAAAKSCVNIEKELPTDHESDAVCLASMTKYVYT